MSVATIGQALKEARAKKSLSLEEVHAKIKIHPRVLLLLEEGKFEKLPSPTFAKSFLRAYADFLELNTAEIMQSYEKESVSGAQPEQVLFMRSVDEKQEVSKARQNVTTVVFVLVGLIAGGVALSYVTQKASGWAKQIQASKTKSTASSKTTLRTPAVVSKKKETASAKKSEWVRSVEQGNFPKIGPKSSLELRLRALDNVWLRVTADGKVLYQGILGRGAVETWSATQSMELWTGNAANMFLSLNKYTLGSPGKGMIKKMMISREGIKIPSAENR